MMEFSNSNREVSDQKMESHSKMEFDPNKKADISERSDSQENQEFKNEETREKDEFHTRNEQLEGKKHPVTDVPYEKKTVEDSEGNEVTGVFPEFDSEYDVQLPEDLYEAKDKEQFEYCNEELKKEIESNPELAEKFDADQLEQIKNGETPDGYTWHHNEEKGKMQLVDSSTHSKSGHTGGKTIWGGGNQNRLI